MQDNLGTVISSLCCPLILGCQSLCPPIACTSTFASAGGIVGPGLPYNDPSKPKQMMRTYALKWTDYDEYDITGQSQKKARYYLNDIYLGTGQNGFENFLQLLDAMPCGSLVHVLYNDPSPMTGGKWSPTTPLDINRSNARLINILHGRRIEIRFPGPPLTVE